jgi:hypothetical protein
MRTRTGSKPVRVRLASRPMNGYGRLGRVTINGVALLTVCDSRESMRFWFDPQL